MTDLEDAALGGEPVQLSTLTARGVGFAWPEAVAVVQEVCSLMRGSEAWESDVVPDPEHIWIRSNGQMTVAPGTRKGGGSPTQSVTALGRLLLSLVDEAQMPVQLRLVALSANSPAPPYSSVDEFSKALAYFERPGKAFAIRDVYRRWHALPPDSAEPGSARTRPAEQQEQKEQPRPRSRRRALAVTAVVVVIVTVSATGVWWFLGRPRLSQLSSVGERASSVISRGATAGKDLLVSGMSAVRERIAGTGTQPQPSSPVEPTAAAEPAARPAGKRGVTATRNPTGPAAQVDPTVTELPIPGIPGFRAFDLGVAVKMPLGTLERAPGASVPTPRQQTVDEQLVVPTTESSNSVYTTSDQDVVPPTPIRPKLPTTLPPGTRMESLSVMDLLVSESGDVLSVRLVPPARDIREAMMLSAAKAWRFAPATRNGRAVRFLKRIWVVMSS